MPLTGDGLEPLLRLSLVQGVGPGRLTQLVRRFGSAEAALAASTAKLLEIPGIGPELAARIRSAGKPSARALARRALLRLEQLGAVAMTPDDPLYPAPFHTVEDPPFLLYAVGDMAMIGTPSVAVVGTRSPTTYGRESARTLSADLASAGFTIVSGMARGIDSLAHAGALSVGGRTIGVLGHGIEQVYPPENRRLFAAVRQHGLLLSEFAPGETPKPGNFPRRNRLITALSEAVVVVEAGHRSGAQHTVGFALAQGKEVLAVPGPIDSPASAGTNQLIREGARLVTCAADIIEELRGVGSAGNLSASLTTRPAPSTSLPSLELFDDDEAAVLRLLGTTPAHVDELASGTDIPVSSLLTTLLNLEIRGVVTSYPGMRYARRP